MASVIELSSDVWRRVTMRAEQPECIVAVINLFFSSSSVHALFNDNEAEPSRVFFVVSTSLSLVRTARCRNTVLQDKLVFLFCVLLPLRSVCSCKWVCFLQWPVEDSTEHLPVSSYGTPHVSVHGFIRSADLHSSMVKCVWWPHSCQQHILWGTCREVLRHSPSQGMAFSGTPALASQQASDRKF